MDSEWWLLQKRRLDLHSWSLKSQIRIQNFPRIHSRTYKWKRAFLKWNKKSSLLKKRKETHAPWKWRFLEATSGRTGKERVEKSLSSCSMSDGRSLIRESRHWKNQSPSTRESLDQILPCWCPSTPSPNYCAHKDIWTYPALLNYLEGEPRHLAFSALGRFWDLRMWGNRLSFEALKALRSFWARSCGGGVPSRGNTQRVDW